MLPQIQSFDFGDPINSMDMATVNCAVVKGDLPIDIYWMFNNYKISTNDGILITRSGNRISGLSIESVQSRHRGLYTCIAINAAGSARHVAELNVNGLCISRTFL